MRDRQKGPLIIFRHKRWLREVTSEVIFKLLGKEARKRFLYIYFEIYSYQLVTYSLSTAVEQAVACSHVTQRPRVRFPGQVNFLVEVFSGVFSSTVRQMSGYLGHILPRVAFGHHHQRSAQGQVLHCKLRHQGCNSARRQVFHCKLRNLSCSFTRDE